MDGKGMGSDLPQKLMERIYYALARVEVDDCMDKVFFREMRVRPDNKASGQVLVIIKGTWDGLPVIAFHQDQGLVLAVSQALSRGDRGKLKWKIDRYQMENDGYDEESIEVAERELLSHHGGS